MLKFYYSNSTNTATPGSWHGTWNDNASAVTKLLDTAASGTGPNELPITENQNSADYNVAMGRWISEALPVGTVFTAGSTTWQSVVGVGEDNAAADEFDRFYIWIWTGNGTGDSSAANLVANANNATEWTTIVAGRQMLNSTTNAIADSYTTIS